MDTVMGAMENSDLLKQLRIDRGAAQVRTRPRLWIAFGVIAVLAIAAGLWFALTGASTLPVHTALAQPMASAGVNASVLDATGYVTARRQATVSAQITGTLTAVLIEEGEHVDAGQVLGRLEDTAQRAALAQAQAQLQAAQALLAQYQAQVAQNRRDLRRAED